MSQRTYCCYFKYHLKAEINSKPYCVLVCYHQRAAQMLNNSSSLFPSFLFSVAFTERAFAWVLTCRIKGTWICLDYEPPLTYVSLLHIHHLICFKVGIMARHPPTILCLHVKMALWMICISIGLHWLKNGLWEERPQWWVEPFKLPNTQLW